MARKSVWLHSGQPVRNTAAPPVSVEADSIYHPVQPMKCAISFSSIATAAARASSGRERRTYAVFGRLASILLPFVLAAGCDAPPTSPVRAPLAFSGSESCRECHAPQFELWRESHHALAMQEATRETVLGDFSGVDFRYFDIVSTFFTRDGNFMVRTDNRDGEFEEFIVSFTFGVTPLQQYLVEMPDGRVQALPFAWDSRISADGGQRWYHLYADDFITHDDPLHWTRREQNWNYMCAECHSTDLDKNYDLQTDTFATTWAEISVGCEACHGPGSRHVASARAGSGNAGLVVDLDDRGRAVWQMNPDTGIAERSELVMRPPRQPEACGRCHSRRSVVTGDYEFGKPLHDTHAPALLEPLLYYPDGQIREEVYVYGSFLQSRMYQAGVTCDDCHDAHSARLRAQGSPGEVCSTCHLPQKFADTTHHRHEAEVRCVDCHMASRVYMGVDARRDHSFRIPRPDLTIATGSPNACNQCHNDRDAGWAAQAVDEWYGGDRETHYAEAIHAGRSGSPSANPLLLRAIDNADYPGIARATALTLLQPPYADEVLASIRRNIANPDAMVRRGALNALERAAPHTIVESAVFALTDPLRFVRIEAARIVSPMQAALPAQYLAAFRRANEERIAAQLANAERPEAQINLGNAYREAGANREAEAAFLQALRFEPLAAAARVNLADLYAQTGRSGDAQAVLRDGIETDANNAVLHHALGLILVRDNRQDEALSEFETATRLQPDNSRFVYVYGVALNSIGRSDQAVAVLEEALQRFPEDFDIHWALTTMLRDQGRIDKAREVAAKLSKLYPRVESVQNLLQSL